MGRIDKLKFEALNHLKKHCTGSYSSRQFKTKTILKFIISLGAIRNVPVNWHSLNTYQVDSVVKYWKHTGLTDESIRRYLSVIRSFLKGINHEIPGLENKSFGLIRKKKNKKIYVTDYILKKISNPTCKKILLLQTEFGLTLSESFKFSNIVHVKDDSILLTRDITHNSLDRAIPITTQAQTDFLNQLAPLTQDNCVNINHEFQLVRHLYRRHAQLAGFTPSVNYRYIYAQNRMSALKCIYPKKDCYKLICIEMGISRGTLTRYMNE